MLPVSFCPVTRSICPSAYFKTSICSHGGIPTAWRQPFNGWFTDVCRRQLFGNGDGTFSSRDRVEAKSDDSGQNWWSIISSLDGSPEQLLVQSNVQFQYHLSMRWMRKQYITDKTSLCGTWRSVSRILLLVNQSNGKCQTRHKTHNFCHTSGIATLS